MPERRNQPLVHLLVNGDARSVPRDSTLAELVDALGLRTRRIAVAVNRSVIPRSEFSTRRLAERDRIEILEAVGGG